MICLITPAYRDPFTLDIPITASTMTHGIMITLEPALRRHHRADECPETVLHELMKRLRDRFEQGVYPDLFLGPVLNFDAEYAKGNTSTSLSHFVWEFFLALCRFILRNPVACESTEGIREIKTRSEAEIWSEMQRIPVLTKPLTMAIGASLWASCELYVWGLFMTQRAAGVLKRSVAGGWYAWLVDETQQVSPQTSNDLI